MKVEIKMPSWKCSRKMQPSPKCSIPSKSSLWVFDYAKNNAEQLRTHFQSESCNTTGDYKTAFFVNGLPVIITTWLYNDYAKPVEQMNEIVMMEYRKLFEIT